MGWMLVGILSFSLYSLQRTSHLCDILRRPRLREFIRLPQMLIQLPLPREFQNKKDAVLIRKVAVHAQHIRMGEVGLNLHFPLHLLLDFALEELVLVQHFDGADEAPFYGPREVDPPEFAFTQWLADIEGAEGPVFAVQFGDAEEGFDGFGGVGVGAFRAGALFLMLSLMLLRCLGGEVDFGDCCRVRRTWWQCFALGVDGDLLEREF